MRKAARTFTAIALAAGATLVAAPAAPAATQAGHFVLFSNRFTGPMFACYTARDDKGNQLAHDCDQVQTRQKSTFWVPVNAKETRVTVADRGTQMFARTHPNNRDLCIRATATGSVHEATDQPCTSS
ncbi:hypothetical protein [Amycolatopsis kentuckyensis]|uniref:hypothetical protein n=1 Tax=Amycolatopsis kentuckyensis TaxID=218823 RepID=UPI000A378E9B|nr:hypothetical protein [Amycolatopsis kentuckyensis]